MKDLLTQRLSRYTLDTQQDEERAIREMLQEIILYALHHAEFFHVAAFQGGTALRILHGLSRFSEDLDFALKEPAIDFRIQPYVDRAAESLNALGLTFELTGRDKGDNAVQSRFLKHDSLGGLLELTFQYDPRKKISIKIELDTHPPQGAVYEKRYHDFPLDFVLTAFDPPSLFAGKGHALLCRTPAKGRDWYDFAWYIAQQIPINAVLLQHALHQFGPWHDQNIEVNSQWLTRAMREKIAALDWVALAHDVRPMLRPQEQAQLQLWSPEFFLEKLSKLHLQVSNE